MYFGAQIEMSASSSVLYTNEKLLGNNSTFVTKHFYAILLKLLRAALMQTIVTKVELLPRSFNHWHSTGVVH